MYITLLFLCSVPFTLLSLGTYLEIEFKFYSVSAFPRFSAFSHTFTFFFFILQFKFKIRKSKSGCFQFEDTIIKILSHLASSDEVWIPYAFLFTLFQCEN